MKFRIAFLALAVAFFAFSQQRGQRPVRRPSDLPHCRFLVQGPSERTAIEAMFKLNHLPPEYQLIPVGFSPEALLKTKPAPHKEAP